MSDNPFTASLRDAILDNSSVRDGLTDDEAEPLIEWGLAQAEIVTRSLPDQSADEAEMRYEELYGALPMLMTRITWAATFRAQKGADWTLNALKQLNEMSQTLHGENAPQIAEHLLTAYAQGADGLDQGAFVLALMEHLTPSEAEATPPDKPSQPPIAPNTPMLGWRRSPQNPEQPDQGDSEPNEPPAAPDPPIIGWRRSSQNPDQDH